MTQDSAKEPATEQAGDQPFDWRLPLMTTAIGIIGLGISIYATLMYLIGLDGVGCRHGLKDACLVIHMPPFADPLNFLPVPWWGVIGYTLIVGLEIVWWRSAGTCLRWRLLQRLLILGGALVSIGLIAFQWAATEQLCPVCTSSAATFMVLLLFHFMAGDRPTASPSPTPPRDDSDEDADPFATQPGVRLNVWQSLAVLVIAVPLVVWGSVSLGESYEPFTQHREEMIMWVTQFPPVLEPHPRMPHRAQIVFVYDEDCPICAYYYGVTLPHARFVDDLLSRDVAIFRCNIKEQQSFFVSVPGLEVAGTPTLVFIPARDRGAPQLRVGWSRLDDVLDWLDRAPRDAAAGRGGMEDYLDIQRNVGDGRDE